MKKLQFAILLTMLCLSCSKEDDSQNPIIGDFKIHMFYVDGEERFIDSCFGQTLLSINEGGKGFQDIYWDNDNNCEKIATSSIDWQRTEERYNISSSTGLLFGDPNGIKEATGTIDNNILYLRLIQDGFEYDVEFKRTN